MQVFGGKFSGVSRNSELYWWKFWVSNQSYWWHIPGIQLFGWKPNSVAPTASYAFHGRVQCHLPASLWTQPRGLCWAGAVISLNGGYARQFHDWRFPLVLMVAHLAVGNLSWCSPFVEWRLCTTISWLAILRWFEGGALNVYDNCVDCWAWWTMISCSRAAMEVWWTMISFWPTNLDLHRKRMLPCSKQFADTTDSGFNGDLMDNAFSVPTKTRFAQKAVSHTELLIGGTFQEYCCLVRISQGVHDGCSWGKENEWMNIWWHCFQLKQKDVQFVEKKRKKVHTWYAVHANLRSSQRSCGGRASCCCESSWKKNPATHGEGRKEANGRKTKILLLTKSSVFGEPRKSFCGQEKDRIIQDEWKRNNWNDGTLDQRYEEQRTPSHFKDGGKRGKKESFWTMHWRQLPRKRQKSVSCISRKNGKMMQWRRTGRATFHNSSYQWQQWVSRSRLRERQWTGYSRHSLTWILRIKTEIDTSLKF